MELIFRKTRSEIREGKLNPALAPRRFQQQVSGVASCAEEASELARRYLEPTEQGFDKPILLASDSPEAKQATRDDRKRLGLPPEE